MHQLRLLLWPPDCSKFCFLHRIQETYGTIVLYYIGFLPCFSYDYKIWNLRDNKATSFSLNYPIIELLSALVSLLD